MGQAVEVVRGSHRPQEDQPPAAGSVPRQLPVARAAARVARCAFTAAHHGQRAGLAPERVGADLRTAAQGAADGPAGQRGPEAGRGRRQGARVPGRARHQVPPVAGVADRPQGRALDHRGRTGGDQPAVWPYAGPRGARVGGTGGAPSAQGELERAALGKEGRAGAGAGARHAVWPAGLPAPPRRLRPDEPGRGARTVHPQRAGRGGIRHPAAILRP